MAQTAVGQHTGKPIGKYQEWNLIDCTTCGFIHVDPLPTPDALEEVYDEKFYANDKPDYLTKYEAEQDYWEKAVYRRRFDTFERLINASGEKSILDIGCSGGFFLRYGKQRGWKTLGIEPSKPAADYARQHSGIEVLEDYFQNIPWEKYQQAFDVIHLSQVLEHLPNPIELCQTVRQALKPNGILCVETPNDFNALQHLVHQQGLTSQYWVSIPHHLNYFTPNSLTGLLTKLGYNVVEKDASFPMELFLLMGDNYVGNDTLGRECHKKRMTFENMMCQTPESQAILDKLYQFLGSNNLGRTSVLFARLQA